MKKILLFCLLLFAQQVFSQNINVDSLIRVAISGIQKEPPAIQLNRDSLFNVFTHTSAVRQKIAIIYKIINSGQGSSREGLIYHRRILAWAQKNNDPISEAIISAELGFETAVNGDIAEGISMAQRALTAAKKTKNNEVIAIAYDNLGCCYSTDEADRASIQIGANCFKEGARFALAGDNDLFVAYNLGGAGSCFNLLGKTDSAAYYTLRSFEYSVRKNVTVQIANSLMDLGNEQTNDAMKLKYFRVGLKIASVESFGSILGRTALNLSNYFKEHGQLDSAFYYARLAYRSVYKKAAADQIPTTLLLASLYTGRNADSALKYTRIYYAARDSMYSIAKAQRAQAMVFAEEQRKQDEASKQAAYENRVRYYVLGIAIIFLVVLIFVLTRNNAKQKKTNLQLQQQKEEIDEWVKEAVIEAALEKIRSRSLAMRQSNELKDVIAIMFEKLSELKVLFGTVAIWLFDKEIMNSVFWVGNNLHPEPRMINLPYDEKLMTEESILRDAWDAWLNGKSYFNKTYSFEQKNSYFNYVFKHNSLEAIPEEVREHIRRAPNHISSLLVEKNSTLYFDTWQGADYNEARVEVFKRVAKVFDQAYVRFLDLKKAEAQAREAQVEASLEKVRSKSLSMQQSSELKDVVAIVFEKLQELDFGMDGSTIVIYTEGTKDTVQWVTNPVLGTMRFDNVYYDTPIMNDFWEARERGDDYFARVYSFEEKNHYFNVSLSHLDNIPEEAKRIMLEAPTYSYAIAYAKKSAILNFSFKGNLPTDIEADVLKRFAHVFEQAYTRFNDLKLAETLAEQAKLDLIKLHAEKKRAEEALTNLQAAQKQLIQSEKMASLGELTAGIAHEIQNPLNFVNNFSEVNREMLDELQVELKAGNIEEAIAIANDIQQNEEKITHHGKRADGIVKGMLQHSRASSGTKEPTDMNALVDEYLRLAYHGLRAKDKTFNCDLATSYDGQLPKVNVIPQDIGRVMLNLFTNAFYAVQQQQKTAGDGYKPTVEIKTSYEKGFAVIKVKDNGTGIPDEIKDKILQPFFTTKPTGEGTGLGLSLSYDIVVKGHGGRMGVDSAQGNGSEFTIFLPLDLTV